MWVITVTKRPKLHELMRCESECSTFHPPLPTVSLLRLRVGGASITEARLVRHFGGTTTQDIITGIKILCSWVCHRRGPLGGITHAWRLEEEGRRKMTRDPVPEIPDDRCVRLTSTDWWVLLASQDSCSFCLSWDRVSCTDFREASTVARKGSVTIRLEFCLPGIAASLTSQGDGADVLLYFLALGGQSGCGKGQLGVDVVGDGGDRGAQVRRVAQVTGGELERSIQPIDTF